MTQQQNTKHGRINVSLSDCDCWFAPNFLKASQAEQLLQQLLSEIDWRQDQIMMFGRSVAIPRLQAFMGDNQINYKYSGLNLTAISWHPAVLELRDQLKAETGVEFNAVLLNLYRNGQDSMGWHSDDEPELGDNPVIASISLGAKRRFLFKNTDKSNPEKSELLLNSGSLLWMGRGVQQNWQHSLPKTKVCHQPRVNLTFRRII